MAYPGTPKPEDAGMRRLGAGEAATGGGAGLFVEADDARLLGFLARSVGLHGRQALRRQVVGVVVLDLLQPLGALGRLRLVDLDAADLQRLVDLRKELVDELLLRHL